MRGCRYRRCCRREFEARPKSWSGKRRNGRMPLTPASALLRCVVNKHTRASNIITSVWKSVQFREFWLGSARILTSSFTVLSFPWLLRRANVWLRRANAYRLRPSTRPGTRPIRHTSTPAHCPSAASPEAGSASAKSSSSAKARRRAYGGDSVCGRAAPVPVHRKKMRRKRRSTRRMRARSSGDRG